MCSSVCILSLCLSQSPPPTKFVPTKAQKCMTKFSSTYISEDFYKNMRYHLLSLLYRCEKFLSKGERAEVPCPTEDKMELFYSITSSCIINLVLMAPDLYFCIHFYTWDHQKIVSVSDHCFQDFKFFYFPCLKHYISPFFSPFSLQVFIDHLT